MIDTTRRDAERYFFQRFVAFDCTDQNDGFDATTIQWFHPAEMKIVLKRLWSFGGRALGMDIAEDFGPGNGARGKRWGVVAGTSPRESSKLDAWLALLSRDSMHGCLVSISYRFPEDLIEQFADEKSSNELAPPT